MQQGKLFGLGPATDQEPVDIPGFHLVEDYITAKEERRLHLQERHHLIYSPGPFAQRPTLLQALLPGYDVEDFAPG